MAMPDKIVLDFSNAKLQKLRSELDKMLDERNAKVLVPEPSGTSFILDLLERAVREWRKGNEN